MARSRKRKKRQQEAPDRHLDGQPVAEVAFSAIRACIDRHSGELMKLPNVLEVRPGFKFTDGWITEQPAIVVVVAQKVPDRSLKANDRLPSEIDGIPVDVAPASPLQQLRHLGTMRSATLPTPEPELWLPGAPEGVSQKRSIKNKPKSGPSPGTNGRNYRKPPNLSLDASNGPMTLICHASPDAGWKTLKAFFGQIASDCTMAMYDFTAPHVFNGLKDAMEIAGGTLEACYDATPSSSRAGEMMEADVYTKLGADKKFKADIAKAGVHSLYPNAYHIKVIVRDGKAFWQSSGNLQNSNQPEEDAFALSVAERRKLLAKHNREWHVVTENPTLAKLFAKYIEWDMSEARRVQKRGVVGAMAIEPPDLMLETGAEELGLKRGAPTPVEMFAPLVIKSEKFKVQPILTPDNYCAEILPILQGAKKTIYFQNQYIHYGPNGGDLDKLVAALVDQTKAGVDVRIILRDGDTREMLEALKNRHFDMQKIKLLGNCHNKGIVVDSEIAVVSSQNWSGDGVQFNRDAGLIMHHPKIADYFEKIFLYDWDKRAHQKALAETSMPQVASKKAKRALAIRGVPERRIAWSDFYGD